MLNKLTKVSWYISTVHSRKSVDKQSIVGKWGV